MKARPDRPTREPAGGSPVPSCRTGAFTLIELLLVLFVIALLATITIGVTRGVMERGRVARAKTELAAIAAALEQFKVQYGDYPSTAGFLAAGPATPETGGAAVGSGDAESKLVNALFGVLGPALAPLKDPNNQAASFLGRSFIDASKLTFEVVGASGEPVLPTAAGAEVANAFVDPWGRRYQYKYKELPWEYVSHVLFSAGADGAIDVQIAANGTPSLAADKDDLLANR